MHSDDPSQSTASHLTPQAQNEGTISQVGVLAERELSTQQRDRDDPTGSCVSAAPQQHSCPARIKVLKILLATGTNRVMQSRGFMTSELNITDKTEVIRVSAVFLLKIIF